MNFFQSRCDGESSWLPAAPLANISTVSLVLMSPSTEMRLNDSATEARNAVCSARWSTAASVMMKHSMVAMFGSIMPAPLHITERITGLPSILSLTVPNLGPLSVVMMPLTASMPFCAERFSASFAMPGKIICIGNCAPI